MKSLKASDVLQTFLLQRDYGNNAFFLLTHTCSQFIAQWIGGEFNSGFLYGLLLIAYKISNHPLYSSSTSRSVLASFTISCKAPLTAPLTAPLWAMAIIEQDTVAGEHHVTMLGGVRMRLMLKPGPGPVTRSLSWGTSYTTEAAILVYTVHVLHSLASVTNFTVLRWLILGQRPHCSHTWTHRNHSQQKSVFM